MRRLLIAAAICALAAPAFAVPGDTSFPLNVRSGPLLPKGYCQLAVTTVVQTSTCTGGIPAGASYAIICNEGTAARWRDDGTAPTATVGNILGTGTATAPFCMGFSTNLAALQWIAESGTAILDIGFYQ